MFLTQLTDFWHVGNDELRLMIDFLQVSATSLAVINLKLKTL